MPDRAGQPRPFEHPSVAARRGRHPTRALRASEPADAESPIPCAGARRDRFPGAHAGQCRRPETPGPGGRSEPRGWIPRGRARQRGRHR